LATALLIAVLLVVSILVVFVVADAQKQQTTVTLEQAIASTHGGRLVGRDGDDSAIRDVAVAVSDPRGLRIDGAMPTGLPDRAAMDQVARTGKPQQRQVVISGRHFAVRTARHGDDTVQAVLDLQEQRAEIGRLIRAILISGAIGVVLASVAAAAFGRRAVRPMADSLQLQRQFVADAAHELRTPLTLLSTRAQLLSRRLRHLDVPDVTAQVQLETGLRGLVGDAASLTEILEDLLIAADRTTELPREPVDLVSVAQDAVAATEASLIPSGIAIRLDTDESAGRIAAGSRAALLRATNAMIDNAVTHARSLVVVDVGARAGFVELTVTDDGPGIDAPALPTIFDRFASQRRDTADPATRRHYGLGLALVSDVAARHGGTVTAAQRSDGLPGAVFRLKLPTAVKRRRSTFRRSR
jgi:signal transduction histidine kinase